VRRAVGIVQIAGLADILLTEDEFDAVRHRLAVSAAAGLVAGRHERQRRQAGDGDIALVIGRAAIATVLMPAAVQVRQALVDRLFGLWRDHILGGAAVGQMLAVIGEHSARSERPGALGQKLATGEHGDGSCGLEAVSKPVGGTLLSRNLRGKSVPPTGFETAF